MSSVRQTAERAFGHSKGIFKRSREVPLHNAEDICKLIYAACILRNFCIINDEDVEEFIAVDDNLNVNDCQNIYQNGHHGILRRQQLINVP